jgi:hypothetical protein
MLTVRPEDAVDGMAPVGPHISKAAPPARGHVGVDACSLPLDGQYKTMQGMGA